MSNIPITNLFDYNRDGQVNTTDALASRNNATNAGNVVRFISLANPPASPEASPTMEDNALYFLDIAAPQGNDELPSVGETIHAGVAVAAPAAGETLKGGSTPRWLVNRLQKVDLNSGPIARYFEYMSQQNTPAIRKSLVASDRVSEGLGFEDSLIDILAEAILSD